MRLPGRVFVPLKSMCSSTCDMPAPSHLPSCMLPAMHHACAETTGALWSSRTMIVRPFSSVVMPTPAGMDGIVSVWLAEKYDIRHGVVTNFSARLVNLVVSAHSQE